MASTNATPTIKPRLMRLPDATAYSGLSRSELYRRAESGEIAFVKAGTSTLVITESLDALVDSLPPAKIGNRAA